MSEIKPKRYTITAALPYVNGPKHIGHLAGAYLPADIYVRYLRLKKEDVVFVCGSDELGTAITMQALKEKVSPRELVDKYHKLSQECFEKLNISFDIYHRTTEKLHFDTAQEFFTDFNNKGLFEEKTSAQYYDEQTNSFLADRYIQGTCPNCKSDKAFGDQCESCGKSLDPTDLIDPISVVTGNIPVLKETKNWYFKLGDYEPWLKEWLVEGKKGKWKANTYGQAKSWIDAGLQPRSMTRDGDWGVPVPLPNAEGKILYVWFDAPIGYISATKQWAIDNQKDWEPYWKSDDTKLVHFVGKDNIVFHCIIFPIMLKASGDYILPTDVPANEFLNLEGQKMSTSRRWSLEMYEYLEAMPDKVDELRYALISNLPENKDSDFSWRDYQLKVNSELVSIIGNFVNRIFVLTHKFYAGKVPQATECSELKSFILEQKAKVEKAIETYSFREALAEATMLARHGNKILTENEPWKVVKTDPQKAGIVLNDCFQIIANMAIMMEPFIPNASKVLWDKLNLMEEMSWDKIGDLTMVKSLSEVKESFYLFNQMEDAVIEKQIEYLQNKTVNGEIPTFVGMTTIGEVPVSTGMTETPTSVGMTEVNLLPEITFDDFSKMDIRACTILSAERVAGTDKLMKIAADLGFETRTIVSGIAHVFSPEDVIGKKVQILANLAPRKIKGIESKGMLLFADHGDKLALVSVDMEVVNGSKVR
jgi:methionyl-tRNA synthetase